MFACAVFISFPKNQVKTRPVNVCTENSATEFYRNEIYTRTKKAFSENAVTDWLETLNIPIIKIDGTIEENVISVLKELSKLQQIPNYL